MATPQPAALVAAAQVALENGLVEHAAAAASTSLAACAGDACAAGAALSLLTQAEFQASRLTDVDAALCRAGVALEALPAAPVLLWGVVALELDALAAARSLLSRYLAANGASSGAATGTNRLSREDAFALSRLYGVQLLAQRCGDVTAAAEWLAAGGAGLSEEQQELLLLEVEEAEALQLEERLANWASTHAVGAVNPGQLDACGHTSRPDSVSSVGATGVTESDLGPSASCDGGGVSPLAPAEGLAASQQQLRQQLEEQQQRRQHYHDVAVAADSPYCIMTGVLEPLEPSSVQQQQQQQENPLLPLEQQQQQPPPLIARSWADAPTSGADSPPSRASRDQGAGSGGSERKHMDMHVPQAGMPAACAVASHNTEGSLTCAAPTSVPVEQPPLLSLSQRLNAAWSSQRTRAGLAALGMEGWAPVEVAGAAALAGVLVFSAWRERRALRRVATEAAAALAQTAGMALGLGVNAMSAAPGVSTGASLLLR